MSIPILQTQHFLTFSTRVSFCPKSLIVARTNLLNLGIILRRYERDDGLRQEVCFGSFLYMLFLLFFFFFFVFFLRVAIPILMSCDTLTPHLRTAETPHWRVQPTIQRINTKREKSSGIERKKCTDTEYDITLL